MMQYQSTLDLWLARAAEDPDLTAELEAVRSDPDGVTDRFYRDLAFGTGGLRGVIGAGTNRMNIYTIRRATQGLADYLNASGLEPVLMLLERMGIPAENITVVPRQREPDGDFPTCPYPNPEIREAMQTGLALCDQVHPDLMLGTDPDCDRMGAAVPDGQGGYRLITGNEMGVLLLDYSAGGTGLPAADVLEYRLAGGAKFMVRPSGTEPKIKIYLSAVGKSEAEADAVNERLAQAAPVFPFGKGGGAFWRIWTFQAHPDASRQAARASPMSAGMQMERAAICGGA